MQARAYRLDSTIAKTPISPPGFCDPGKIGPVRLAGLWAIGLWELVLGAGCVRPEGRSGLDEVWLADAASGVLFRSRPERGVELVPGDRAHWASPEPMSVADGEQVELWLYACGLEKLQVTSQQLPPLDPDPRPFTCLEEGAPCPLGAYTLNEQGWAPTDSRRQPWARDNGDPGRCAIPGSVASNTVNIPGSGSEVHLLTTLSEAMVLLSASDALGPGNSGRGLLKVYALPIGEPLASRDPAPAPTDRSGATDVRIRTLVGTLVGMWQALLALRRARKVLAEA